MLFKEEAFLLLYLSAQFFFSWHIGHVFGGKKLVAVVQDGVAGYRLVRSRA